MLVHCTERYGPTVTTGVQYLKFNTIRVVMHGVDTLNRGTLFVTDNNDGHPLMHCTERYGPTVIKWMRYLKVDAIRIAIHGVDTLIEVK